MAALINIPDPLKKSFDELLAEANIDLEIAAGSAVNITVIEETETVRREGSVDTLYTHGWINCQTARAVGEHLGLPYGDVGKILNFFDIKVRNCELGCF